MIEYTKEMMEYIGSKDPKLNNYINKYGFIEINENEDIFSAIVFTIIGQMLSNKAAQTIRNRFVDLVSELKPSNILNVSDDEIRSCGISYGKIKYIKDLSRQVINEDICFEKIEELSDEELIFFLTQIKGIGKWTAEMIASFSLGRLNIFSFEDAALRAGILKVHDEFKTLSKVRFNKLKKLYSPYCTVAAIYYYHINDYEKEQLK